MKKKHLYFLTKIDTTKISVFYLGPNLIIVSVNYDIYKEIWYKGMSIYWVVRKVHAAKDLNLINEIKNLNLLRFNFPSKSHELSGQPNTYGLYRIPIF